MVKDVPGIAIELADVIDVSVVRESTKQLPNLPFMMGIRLEII